MIEVTEIGLLEWINKQFISRHTKIKQAKYKCLFQVIQLAIREGILVPGDQLPSEQILGQHLPISLVTVRKCYTLLANCGVISREHGRGTFVSAEEQSVSDLWHFRFRKPNGADFMPIYNRILTRSIRSNNEISKHFLGQTDKFVRIQRSVNIGSLFNCYSELHLRHDMFKNIVEWPINELERMNLRDILAREFQHPTLHIEQNLSLCTVPKIAAQCIGLEMNKHVMVLAITGFSFDNLPITYQKIWIPPTQYELNLPATVKSDISEKPELSQKIDLLREDLYLV